MKTKKTEMVDVVSDTTCFVYDAKTGSVQHVHRVVTLKASAKPKPSEIEKRALGLAAEQGTKVSQLKTLMVSPEQLQPGATYRVDPKKKLLVSEPTKPMDKLLAPRSKIKSKSQPKPRTK